MFQQSERTLRWLFRLLTNSWAASLTSIIWMYSIIIVNKKMPRSRLNTDGWNWGKSIIHIFLYYLDLKCPNTNIHKDYYYIWLIFYLEVNNTIGRTPLMDIANHYATTNSNSENNVYHLPYMLSPKTEWWSEGKMCTDTQHVLCFPGWLLCCGFWWRSTENWSRIEWCLS